MGPKSGQKANFWTPKKCIELILANLSKCVNGSAALHTKKPPQMGPTMDFWTPKKCIELILANLSKCINDSAVLHTKSPPQEGSSFLDPGAQKNASNSFKPTCQNVSMAALLCTQKAHPQGPS
jgi:hypothetical protein